MPAGTPFKDTPIAPSSLDGLNHVDKSIAGKRYVKIQADLLTNPTYRLYFRVDETAAAPGATLATFDAEGVLTAGGNEPINLDPDPDETPYIHFLLADSAGAAQNGGANDRILFYTERVNPD